MSTAPETVDDYIAAQPAAHQDALQEVRRRVLRAAPDAMESVRYGMPAYRLPNGRPVYFAGWAKHLSLHDIPNFSEPLESEVAPMRSGKDTVKFPYRDGVPFDLVERIVRAAADH